METGAGQALSVIQALKTPLISLGGGEENIIALISSDQSAREVARTIIQTTLRPWKKIKASKNKEEALGALCRKGYYIRSEIRDYMNQIKEPEIQPYTAILIYKINFEVWFNEVPGMNDLLLLANTKGLETPRMKDILDIRTAYNDQKFNEILIGYPEIIIPIGVSGNMKVPAFITLAYYYDDNHYGYNTEISYHKSNELYPKGGDIIPSIFGEAIFVKRI